MRRKGAFFKRIAAMQCVAPTNPKPAWVQCYHLLIQALEGYKLSLDYKDIPHDFTSGWPCVKLRVLHELIYSARRMGNPAIAVRHLSFLLHAMNDHLSEADKREMSDVLVSYTSRCEGTPQVLAVDNGIILPPVPFLKFPQVRSFKLLNLPPHLRPMKIQKMKEVKPVKSSPFIYSPLQLGEVEEKDGSKLDFSWVQGDVCEVSIQVSNPLPYELKVSNVGLISDGVDFEGYPASISLPPESGPFQVKIMGTPTKTGELNVLGYTTTVLGVRSHCRLRDMPWIPFNNFEIEVVPALPKLQVSTSLPKAASFSSMADSDSVVTSATACLFAGQRCECQIVLTNNGKLPVEHINLSLDSKTDKSILSEIVRWNDDNLSTQLPLAPGSQASFTLYLYGESNFVPSDRLHPADMATARQYHSPLLNSDSSGIVNIESLLKVQYSGGPGLSTGHCRQCSVALTVEIQPSLVIQNWDVIPADSHTNCHIILDFDNPSLEEIELQYSKDNSMSIDGKETCRVAIQIPRCDITSSTLEHVPLEDEPPGGIRRQRKSDESLEEKDPVSPPIRKLLSEHLDNLLDIRYKVVSNDVEGSINLSKLWWSNCALEVLQKSAISWDMRINDRSHLGGSRIRCACGEIVNVTCTVTNQSDYNICDSEMETLVSRNLDVGAKRLQLNDDVIHVGNNTKNTTKISKGERRSLDCTFVFLSAGRYCVDVYCHGNAPSTHLLIPKRSAQSNQDSADRQGQSDQPDESAQRQTWKYIPSIEFSVKESQS